MCMQLLTYLAEVIVVVCVVHSVVLSPHNRFVVRPLINRNETTMTVTSIMVIIAFIFIM